MILYQEEIKIEEVKTEEILVVKQWESECENCDVLEEKIHKNENINWEIISSNSHVLKDYINRELDNENYQWNYQILSSNESLTKTFVSKNLHKEWNWHIFLVSSSLMSFSSSSSSLLVSSSLMSFSSSSSSLLVSSILSFFHSSSLIRFLVFFYFFFIINDK